MAAKILLIGGGRGKDGAYLAALDKRYDVFTAASGKQGVKVATQQRPRVVVVNACSLGTTGERICRMLNDSLVKIPILHIHPGPRGGAHSPAHILLFEPVSPRRLMSHVERLISVDQDEVIDCGPFYMNVSRRLLVAHGKETQLTPKQALLIEMFLRHPGQIIERKKLMEEVWNTDYLGDTRTLDVHVRWVRQVLEEGGKPRYLKTVRGVGYKLVVPDLM